MAKVKLTPAETKHTQFVFDLHRDPRVMKGHGMHEPISPPMWRNIIQGIYPGWEVNYIISRGAAQLGFVCLQDLSKADRRAQLMISIAPEFWGKRIAQEALADFIDYAMEKPAEGGLGVECLWAGIFEENVASIHLFQKMGFDTQGRIPNYYRYGSRRFARVLLTRLK